MSLPKLSLGWDDTIKPQRPASLSNTFNRLSLSPENKRKRRLDDFVGSNATGTLTPSQSASPVSNGGVHKRQRVSAVTPRSRHGSSGLSIRRRLECLDQAELIALVEELVEQQPQLGNAVDQLAPGLSVAQALDVLKRYHTAIVDALPLGDQQSDYAFLRVRRQWTGFFVALVDYTSAFTDHDKNEVLRTLEFLDGATQLLHTMPQWTTPANNYLLNCAYVELADSWKQTLTKASDSLPFALVTGAAWDARFSDHITRSRGKMVDDRTKEPEVQVVRLCEGVTS